MMNALEVVQDRFYELFRDQPLLVRSPGRINLIGDHTDYNMGFVLPAAIDRAMYFALAPRKDNRFVFYSTNYNERVEGTINKAQKQSQPWANYLVGVVDQLTKRDCVIGGFNCVFGGDIPIGAGMSSSAAIETGLAFGLNQLFNFDLDRRTIARLAQKAENDFVGVQCGIMDQFANMFGLEGRALQLDCQTLEYIHFPFDFEDVSIVLFNSGVSHSLAASTYNERRRECRDAVAIIQKENDTIHSLRDVTKETLIRYKSKMDPVNYQRSAFVLQENERVFKACEALTTGDVETFGSLMKESHKGLSDQYQVSCRELDFLVDVTKNIPQVYGSRMMGGGFGGCTINLIKSDAVEFVNEIVTMEYKHKFNNAPEIYSIAIEHRTNVVTTTDYARV